MIVLERILGSSGVVFQLLVSPTVRPVAQFRVPFHMDRRVWVESRNPISVEARAGTWRRPGSHRWWRRLLILSLISGMDHALEVGLEALELILPGHVAAVYNVQNVVTRAGPRSDLESCAIFQMLERGLAAPRQGWA